jgi:hypothetical protein
VTDVKVSEVREILEFARVLVPFGKSLGERRSEVELARRLDVSKAF